MSSDRHEVGLHRRNRFHERTSNLGERQRGSERRLVGLYSRH